MGGTLFLKDPANPDNQPDRSNVCVSGYDSQKANYALSNFENNGGKGYWFNDPDIGPVHFATSEHYLHFQKLNPEGKEAHLEVWEQNTSPKYILDLVKQIKPAYQKYLTTPTATLGQFAFNDDAWNKDNKSIQMQINATKYQQSPEFRKAIDTAVDLGKSFGDNKGAATIIEDTSSAAREEKKWGTGPDGRGTNILGNSQTAFANTAQKPQPIDYTSRTPDINDLPTLATYQQKTAQDLYIAAEAQFKSGVQNALIAVRAEHIAPKPPATAPSDTSELPNVDQYQQKSSQNTAQPPAAEFGASADTVQPVNNLEKESLQKIKAALGDEWKVPENVTPGQSSVEAINSSGKGSFTVTNNKLISTDNDVESHKACFKAFYALHNDREPTITCPDTAAIKIILQAFREINANEPNKKLPKFIDMNTGKPFDLETVKKLDPGTTGITMTVADGTTPANTITAEPAPPSSSLTIETPPPEDRKPVSKERTINNLTPDNLARIQAAVGDKWQIPAATGDTPKKVVATNTETGAKFEVTATQFKPITNDVETYKAVLKAYYAVHPNKPPRVTSDDPALNKIFEQAHKELYPDKPVPKITMVKPPEPVAEKNDNKTAAAGSPVNEVAPKEVETPRPRP